MAEPISSSSANDGIVTVPIPTLDREHFNTTVKYIGLRTPAKLCGVVVKALGKHKLSPGKVKPIMPDEKDSSKRIILLNYRPGDVLPPTVEDLVQQHTLEVVEHSEIVGYAQLTSEEVLRQIIPEGIAVPVSFEQVGHIAHLNLKAVHDPYKYIIGQVLLDKVPSLRTVVNKVGTIDTTFREFNMEVLAGDADFNTEVKQHGCIFRFDYSKVYWNSRLQTEHARLCDMFGAEDCIYDVMAGIGPFAIPSAMKGVRTVKANDLNVHAFESMKSNVALNKVHVDCYNMDGRDFIHMAIRKFMDPTSDTYVGCKGQDVNNDLPCNHHFVMNLPAIAITFLDAFSILDTMPQVPKPFIHVYCFSKEADPKVDALQQVEATIGRPLPPDHVLQVHDVRNVAPAKQMMCVSFRYPPPSVSSAVDGDNPEAKRRRTET